MLKATSITNVKFVANLESDMTTEEHISAKVD